MVRYKQRNVKKYSKRRQSKRRLSRQSKRRQSKRRQSKRRLSRQSKSKVKTHKRKSKLKHITKIKGGWGVRIPIENSEDDRIQPIEQKDLDAALHYLKVTLYKDKGKPQIIGMGAHARVYEVSSTVHKTPLVLKMISMKKGDFDIESTVENDYKELRDSLKELVVLYYMRGSNYITRIYGHFYKNSVMYILLEYGGDPLSRYISNSNSIMSIHNTSGNRNDEKLRRGNIVKDICAGLTHLHSIHYLHGDLHSGNIVVYSNTTMLPSAKLMDFGEVKKNYTYSVLTGACRYFPPEALVKESIIYDQKIDIFCLGCIMFQLTRISMDDHDHTDNMNAILSRLNGDFAIKLHSDLHILWKGPFNNAINDYLMAQILMTLLPHIIDITDSTGNPQLPNDKIKQIQDSIELVDYLKLTDGFQGFIKNMLMALTDESVYNDISSELDTYLNPNNLVLGTYMYKYMLDCLNLNPQLRPTAAVLCTKLNNIDVVTWTPKGNKTVFENNMKQLDDLKNVVITLRDLDHFDVQLLLKDISCCDDDDYNGLQPFLKPL
jgi:serine/threonine protein kinase